MMTTVPAPVEVTTPVEALMAAPAAVEPVPSAQESVPLPEPPDEVAVEFGVKMSVETGAVITKASGEGNFKINLSWKKSAASGK